MGAPSRGAVHPRFHTFGEPTRSGGALRWAFGSGRGCGDGGTGRFATVVASAGAERSGWAAVPVCRRRERRRRGWSSSLRDIWMTIPRLLVMSALEHPDEITAADKRELFDGAVHDPAPVGKYGPRARARVVPRVPAKRSTGGKGDSRRGRDRNPHLIRLPSTARPGHTSVIQLLQGHSYFSATTAAENAR